MRHALIIAGGSGTRLWPMSTRDQPKQLIPFIESVGEQEQSGGSGEHEEHGGGGKSLLRIAMDRLEGLVEPERVYICAGQAHKQVILENVPGMTEDRFIGEPMGRDTLNAVGLGTAVIGEDDPEAVVAVFTADHLIEPVDEFQKVVERGYQVAEARDPVLVTFGITPTHAATGYGYLELDKAYDEDGETGARRVHRFKEKPDAATAEQYYDAGPERYLWNSGMFVWRARTLMRAIERFHPANYAGLARIAADWRTADRDRKLRRTYPSLEKISVDYAVMEPASRDPEIDVAAVPMPLKWRDVGSWPSFARTLPTDEAGNAASGCENLLLDTKNTLVASDEPDHLITTIGVEDLIVVHTARATLVCRRDDAERIKELHGLVGEKFGDAML